MRVGQLVAFLLIISLPHLAGAQTKYVTDEFEIMLRTGQSTQHEILRALKSGTPVTVLESNVNYTHVRLASGQTGWVLTRYLINQASGRDRYDTLKKKYDDLKSNFDSKVEKEKDGLRAEMAKLEEIAKKPLELRRENQALKAELELQKTQLNQALRESEVLKSPLKDRQWFVSGGMVAIFSLILGIILTRIPLRKRKRWDQL